MKQYTIFGFNLCLLIMIMLQSSVLTARKQSFPADSIIRPSIQGFTSGPISKKLLAEADSITLLNEAGEVITDIRVMSFDFVATYAGDIYQKSNQGKRFSEEVKTFISKAPKGTKIFFEKIIIEQPDGQIRETRILYLTVD
ncbi:MAG TPA: hypothetical protein P5531_12645 [Bacteroidales bacterium]|nr:hypothetical protein [Bacteroidales bacterium]HSA43659.1 hypothetical protein [Bacteroidales bacterium]